MQKPPAHFQTERLSLRPIALADMAEAYAKWGNNIDVARYMSWKTQDTPAGTEEFVRYALRAWESGEEYTWYIELKNAPGLIGSVGLRVRESDADFGYLLMPEFWGRGYMAEAVRPVLDWCLALPGMTRVWAVHHADNPNSGRVMEKLGLRRETLLPKNKIYPQINADEPQDEYLWTITL